MDFLGNISLRLIGVLSSIAIMAAAYFLFEKPTLNTVNNATGGSGGISGIIKQAEQQENQFQQQANKHGGGQSSAGSIDLSKVGKLQKCVSKAGQNVNQLQRCTSRYTP